MKYKKDGICEGYFVTEGLSYKGNYKNDLKDGSWTGYFDNGQLWYKGNFKKGKKEGSYIEYNSNGIVKKEYTGTFKDGIKISE